MKRCMIPLTRGDIAAALRKIGLSCRDIVFLHSSLRSMGSVKGGSDTVVDAFLEVLGSGGTLVVPAFTFVHGKEDDPVFDPEQDASEVGRITESVRTRSGAKRSRHVVHSVAAIGSRAGEITAVQNASAWAGDGPFWQIYWRDAYIMVLGVPYLRCTFFHVIEQLLQVPYRRWTTKKARLRKQDGTLGDLPTAGFGPKPGFQGNDFNKLGSILEERRLSHVGYVGNAVGRLFRARDAVEVGVAEYRRDPLLFVQTEDRPTQLRDGFMIGELHNEKCVVNPAEIFS